MSVHQLPSKQKDPVGECVWSLQIQVAALHVMAKEPQPFFRKEIADLRVAAQDLIEIAAKAEAHIQLGSK
jgi:hypothetical protein